MKKIDFIIDETEKIYSENLLDNDQKFENDFATFYIKFNNRPKFQNQQKNVSQEIVKDGDIYFGEDDQPEMFGPEIIEHIEFHDFSDYKKKLNI